MSGTFIRLRVFCYIRQWRRITITLKIKCLPPNLTAVSTYRFMHCEIGYGLLDSIQRRAYFLCNIAEVKQLLNCHIVCRGYMNTFTVDLSK